MKKHGNRVLYAVMVGTAVLFLSSCASVRGVPGKSTVGNLMELVNSKDVTTMGKITNIPMLIDGEIVSREKEVTSFWAQVFKAGFRLQEQQEAVVEPVDSTALAFFGDTMEVRTFFKKYLPKTAITAEIKGTGGTYIFLLSGRSGKYPYIFGFTGPLQ